MKFLPYQRFSLYSPLAPNELLQHLSEEVEPTKWLRMPWNEHKAFQGKVDGDTFAISRDIHYRNSFLPFVKGTVSAEPAGSRVEVRMRLHTFVIVFACVWVGFALSIGVTLAVATLREGRNALPALIPLGMVAFLYLISMLGFRAEAKRTRLSLEKLATATSSAR